MNSNETLLVSDLPCKCMCVSVEGKVFNDAEGKPHQTQYGALEAIYRTRTARNDFNEFMAKVEELCVEGCPGTYREARQCAHIIYRSLCDYDPDKGTPWALCRYRLTNNRT